jgi:ABC-type Fe3+/spermidine/putrescine transport system ATPase subunit
MLRQQPRVREANLGEVCISDLTKSYLDGVPILNKINLTIRSGEFFTLLGPSGCGKTTLLRTIVGFLRQDSGTITYDGGRIDLQPAHKRNIGMVFQDYAIFPHLSVWKNIAFGLRPRRLSATEIKERVAEAIRTVRLEGFEHRMPSALSGGQQQRVGIARALAIRPRLLLMDEPLSNLDAKLRVDMREDIRDIQRKLSITTIYVTHDQEEALAISDRVCVMQGGVAEQVGTPFEIYRQPTCRFSAGFVGTMNFLKSQITEGTTLRFADRDWQLSVAAPIGPVDIAIRPEDVTLDQSASGICLSGRILKSTFLGREARCLIQTEHGTLNAPLDNPTQTLLNEVDAPITVRLPFSRIHLFAQDGSRVETAIVS